MIQHYNFSIIIIMLRQSLFQARSKLPYSLKLSRVETFANCNTLSFASPSTLTQIISRMRNHTLENTPPN